MDSKSRSGRFDLSANKLVEDFNATIMIEQRNCPFDIKGSQAHATMLGRQGIISQEDAEAICKGLDQVAQEIRDGKFVFRTADEDIHMAIEKRMTEIVGPAGGRLHTARSRNDQTTVTTKMMLRATIREVQAAIRDLQKEFVDMSISQKSTWTSSCRATRICKRDSPSSFRIGSWLTSGCLSATSLALTTSLPAWDAVH